MAREYYDPNKSTQRYSPARMQRLSSYDTMASHRIYEPIKGQERGEKGRHTVYLTGEEGEGSGGCC